MSSSTSSTMSSPTTKEELRILLIELNPEKGADKESDSFGFVA